MSTKLYIYFIAVLLSTAIFALAGCGGTSTPQSGQGAVSAKLVWNSSKTTGKVVASAPTGVATVRLAISGTGIATIQQDFPAADGKGTLTGVPVGSGLTVTAAGLDSSGTVIYQGSVGSVTILGGQTTDVGTITMTAVPPAQAGFTTEMISGKTFAEGPSNTVTFNSDGTFIASDSTDAMTWAVNTSGQIVVHRTTDNSSAIITLVSGNLTSGWTISTTHSDGNTPELSTLTLKADLAGTWYAAGIKTPIKNTSSSANFGYDVEKLELNADGSGTLTPISSSDSMTGETFAAGTFTISSDGMIPTGTEGEYSFLNAGKDVMCEFRIDSGTGEQQLFVSVKKAASYSSADLAGAWYGAGIKTPIKNTSSSANFGYDVEKLELNADGSGTLTQISSSDSMTGETLAAGTFTISSDGMISTGTPGEYFFMNAGKDVMYLFRIDSVTGEQQLFVSVKKAASYSSADLAGTWYGAGIKTPIKNTSSSANFGYDVEKLELNADGSGTLTQISSSDSMTGETLPVGTFTISSDGIISTGTPGEYFFLNAGKDVMYQYRIDSGTGEQQLFVSVKK